MNIFGVCLAPIVIEEGWEAKKKRQLIYCTKSWMKEFDKHFLECILERVKAEANQIGENGPYFFSTKIFFIQK